jgi:hypothetical protein
VLGPSSQQSFGIFYFRESVVDLQAYGKVEYMVAIKGMEGSVDELYGAIRDALEAETV